MTQAKNETLGRVPNNTEGRVAVCASRGGPPPARSLLVPFGREVPCTEVRCTSRGGPACSLRRNSTPTSAREQSL